MRLHRKCWGSGSEGYTVRAEDPGVKALIYDADSSVAIEIYSLNSSSEISELWLFDSSKIM